ncbi:MAG: 1-(5-phosphoribosyl)-5-[(5-phosphoribosylamino)methylideneamino]imidazole-4-carboxamide isomerase [Clostridiales bacterium]|nr:1-(5-phosphoribosyl)-5-[(5-phosphoribosylamino)methylideneamino]imidazole-4-carboxamide isomerase [Clostridiales bacterium]
MKIFPAIDLRGGRVVRLSEGDYDRMTVYGDDPLAVARGFREAGATCLHVVDLDGAKDGTQANFPVIRKLIEESGLFVEVGGGGRDEESVARYMDLGLNRMILGTAAIEQPRLLEKLAAKYPGRIAAGVDARDGFVAIHGWKVITDRKAEEFMAGLPARGVDTVIYTDISRDGMLQGTNLEAYRRVKDIPGLQIVASGGISFPEEITALQEMGIYGAIIGKALYDGKLPLEEALKRCGE